MKNRSEMMFNIISDSKSGMWLQFCRNFNDTSSKLDVWLTYRGSLKEFCHQDR